MEMSHEIALPATLQRAWQALNDIELLQACIPGCESITAAGEQRFELLITAAVGPVKARFKGRMELSEMDPPKAYTLLFEGQGGVAGHARGQARVTLSVQDEQSTLLAYSARAQVGGRIAQVGSRLVDMAAQKLAADFFKAFSQRLAAGGDGESATTAAPA